MTAGERTGSAIEWSSDTNAFRRFQFRVAPSPSTAASTAASGDVFPETTSAMAATMAHWEELADPAYEPSRTPLGARLRALRRALLVTGTTPLDAEQIDARLGRGRAVDDT